MDFSVIIPKMREAIEDYVAKKAAQGKILTEREAVIKWLDRYYESWITTQMGLVSPSEQSGGAERRRHARLPIEISAYYRVLWVPQAEKPAENAPAEVAKVVNVSAGGLYIVTGRSYPLSTLVEIQFELPTIADSISAFAMVVWCKDHGHGRFGHGLQFSHIETVHVDMIQEAIMERLLGAPVISLQEARAS